MDVSRETCARVKACSWLDYSKASAEYQAIFRAVNSRLGPNWDHYCMWITRKGMPSHRPGHWQWTKECAAVIDSAITAMTRGEDVRTRGDLRDYKAGEFHLAVERS